MVHSVLEVELMGHIESPAIEQFHPAEDRADVMRSSDIVVPILIERFHPQSVLDLGCNTGGWLRSFINAGITALGVDGSGVKAAFEHDLREPFKLGYQFDLVLCLEVAEHLPEESADVLVDSAIRHARQAVIWSAATPGQGGWQHLNEQPHAYWVEKFASRGWEGKALAELIPQLPHDYYRSNLWEFIGPGSAMDRLHQSQAEMELLARAGVTLETFERWVMDYAPGTAEEKALELLSSL